MSGDREVSHPRRGRRQQVGQQVRGRRGKPARVGRGQAQRVVTRRVTVQRDTEGTVALREPGGDRLGVRRAQRAAQFQDQRASPATAPPAHGPRQEQRPTAHPGCSSACRPQDPPRGTAEPALRTPTRPAGPPGRQNRQGRRCGRHGRHGGHGHCGCGCGSRGCGCGRDGIGRGDGGRAGRAVGAGRGARPATGRAAAKAAAGTSRGGVRARRQAAQGQAGQGQTARGRAARGRAARGRAARGRAGRGRAGPGAVGWLHGGSRRPPRHVGCAPELPGSCQPNVAAGGRPVSSSGYGAGREAVSISRGGRRALLTRYRPWTRWVARIHRAAPSGSPARTVRPCSSRRNPTAEKRHRMPSRAPWCRPP